MNTDDRHDFNKARLAAASLGFAGAFLAGLLLAEAAGFPVLAALRTLGA